MRARYYYRPGHPKANANGFVSEEDLGSWQDTPLARNAAIMMDRFYENTKATDGTDIGSRRKHREYMKQHGLTTIDEYGPGYWQSREKERQQIASGEADRKERREQIGRAAYEHKMKRRR